MTFTSEPIVAAPAPAEEDQSFDLAFDMGFDAPDTKAPEIELKSLDDIHLDLAGVEKPPTYDMAHLAHEFDLQPLPEPAAPATPELVDPLADLDSLDFSLPATPVAGNPAPAPADDPFALPDLPASDTPNYGAASPSYAGAPQFDMSGIDLDLPVTESIAGADELTAAPATSADLSANHMEMETKLDLAIAYQEIGDKEGARELLDEVIKGGSHEQVGKANAMRAKLA
jgi:pilus assembly protein FimV